MLLGGPTALAVLCGVPYPAGALGTVCAAVPCSEAWANGLRATSRQWWAWLMFVAALGIGAIGAWLPRVSPSFGDP